MKVLLVNGSPKKEGCTYTALCEIASELNKYNVESEIFQIGKDPQQGCTACNRCHVAVGGCVRGGDKYKELTMKMEAADGIIIGSPVYYAGPTGTLCALLDRVFYSSGGKFKYKPAAAIVICRRGGASSAFDRLNKYFTISEMPLVTSHYWNCVHGHTPEDVRRDLEGMQIMRTLGKNMVWLLKCIKNGEPPPETEERIWTSFPDGL